MKTQNSKLRTQNHNSKVFCLLAIALSFALLALSVPANAQNVDLSKQIDDLKSKVASKVAELKLVEKRGFIGTVTDVSGTQITVLDINKNVRFVDVDEFTKFSSPEGSSSFGISDIEKDSHIGVLGLYNKESRRTLARFVNVMELPQYVVGVVAEKDAGNFNLTVATENANVAVSVETVSRIYSADEEGKLLKAGFSDIEISQNIIVSGFFDPKLKNTITAGRIIIFPGVPKNPQIELDFEEEIVPSTGSGKKLTPIVR